MGNYHATTGNRLLGETMLKIDVDGIFQDSMQHEYSYSVRSHENYYEEYDQKKHPWKRTPVKSFKSGWVDLNPNQFLVFCKYHFGCHDPILAKVSRRRGKSSETAPIGGRKDSSDVRIQTTKLNLH